VPAGRALGSEEGFWSKSYLIIPSPLTVTVSLSLATLLRRESSGERHFTHTNRGHWEFVPRSRIFLAGKNI
jgi:hypothetical protein